METVADFVQRTDGPAMPFVPEWYPWIYAHHYLRLEAAGLPAEFRRGATSISLGDARELIYLWCGLSGEGVQPAVRALADAYLRRWGMVRPGREVDPEVGPEMGPGSPSPAAARGAPVDGMAPVVGAAPVVGVAPAAAPVRGAVPAAGEPVTEVEPAKNVVPAEAVGPVKGVVPAKGVVAGRRPRRRRPAGRIPAPRGRTRRALVAPVAGAASST